MISHFEFDVIKKLLIYQASYQNNYIRRTRDKIINIQNNQFFIFYLTHARHDSNLRKPK